MLNTLPVEIIDLVLDQVGDRPTLYSDHEDRLHTLAACCLVCRSWRELAQPKLWRRLVIVDLASCKQVASAVSAERGAGARLAQATRMIFAEESTVTTSPVEEDPDAVFADAVLRQLPMLEEVLLAGWRQETFWGILLSLPNLRILHLECLSFPPFPPGAVLPSLVELAFGSVCIDSEDAGQLFSTTSLPSLRALSLSNIETTLGFDLPPALPASLVSQLDMIQADTAKYLDFPLPLLRGATPFLYFVSFEFRIHPQVPDFLRHPPRHLGVQLELWGPHSFASLKSLVSWTEDPLTLYLPNAFNPYSPKCTTAIFESAISLFQTCIAWDVEVIWISYEENPLTVSKEFWAHARKLKANEAAEKAQKGASGKKLTADQADAA